MVETQEDAPVIPVPMLAGNVRGVPPPFRGAASGASPSQRMVKSRRSSLTRIVRGPALGSERS